MLATKQALIVRELEKGTGAGMEVRVDGTGRRSALTVRFADLDARHGPEVRISPYGLRKHSVVLSFGSFSGDVIRQIGQAPDEDVRLAQALVASIDPDCAMKIDDQISDSWVVRDGSFRMMATMRHDDESGIDERIARTCREIITPLMAAMAELIGYNSIVEGFEEADGAIEGAVSRGTVLRRERNPRNQLLCLRIHGKSCIVCAVQPEEVYGEAGDILEVHHLEMLAALSAPRRYDPSTDLVPLCPSCHRAVHTRRPVPWTPVEIMELMERADA